MKGLKTIILSLAVCSIAWAAPQNVILSAMDAELDRSAENLVMEGQAKPYFIAYRVVDWTSATVQASLGTITESDESRYRSLSVGLRVGERALDNTGGEEKPWWEQDAEDRKYSNMQVPIDDDTLGLKHQLWLATDHEYKKAVEDLAKKKKEIALKPDDDEDEESTADFSKESPEVYIGEEVKIAADQAEWEQRIKRYSALFDEYKDILISHVRFDARARNTYFVSSEGSKIQDGNLSYTIEIEAFTRSKDGMALSDCRKLYSHDGVWDDAEIEKEVTQMAQGLIELSEADECESYVGPVLIDAPASGAFVYAVLAPLLKADKESWEDEDGLQNKVGQRILPSSISVYDDPAITEYKGLTVVGNYRYDHEGVKAQKVNLISRGVLRGFLLSRSPVKGFAKSNGHGRYGVQIGNLIVESSAPSSDAALKSRLIAEARKQGRPYGLFVTSARQPSSSGRNIIISSSSGGQSRVMSGLNPVAVYKVYTDGNEELVRGVQVLAGSPLATLGKIIAAGGDHGVWSIASGSGSVVAPSLLISELEVRKSKAAKQTLPILPPPEE